MSVLIKGMDMPKSGRILLAISAEDEAWLSFDGTFIRCEAVEVPTPHGRLIDADELELDADWNDWDNGYTAYSQLEVNTAPTIIEAEE